MSVGQALAKNSALQIGGKLLGTVFGLVTFYLMLHFFDTDGFGLYTTAMTYVTIFAIIVDFGLTLTTTQMISEKGVNESKVLGNLVSMRILSATIFMSLAPISALFIPQYDAIMPIIIIGSVTYFISAIAQMFLGVFQKRLDVRMVVIAETVNRTISLIGVIAVGLSGGSIVEAALAFLAGIAVQIIIVVFATNKHVKFRPEIDLKVWREIVHRSWPLGISILFNLLYLKGDIFFMSIFNISATEIGQYGSAYKVVDVMTMIPVTFMGLMLPLMTVAWSQKHVDQFHKHLQNGFDLLSIIALPFACGAVVLGVPIMTALKSDLTLAGQVLGVLGPAVAILYFGSLYGHAVVALNKQKLMTWAYAVVAVFAIAGYVIYIPKYGAWAAAWVTLGSELFIAVLAYLVVTRASKASTSLKMFLRALAASAVMTAAIVYIPSPNVFLTMFGGIVVYIAALTAFGGPQPKDVMLLFRGDGDTIVTS